MGSPKRETIDPTSPRNEASRIDEKATPKESRPNRNSGQVPNSPSNDRSNKEKEIFPNEKSDDLPRNRPEKSREEVRPERPRVNVPQVDAPRENARPDRTLQARQAVPDIWNRPGHIQCKECCITRLPTDGARNQA